jgi:hypothetical protein
VSRPQDETRPKKSDSDKITDIAPAPKLCSSPGPDRVELGEYLCGFEHEWNWHSATDNFQLVKEGKLKIEYPIVTPDKKTPPRIPTLLPQGEQPEDTCLSLSSR